MPLQAATTPAADVVFIMEAAQVTDSSSLRPDIIWTCLLSCTQAIDATPK